jgi:hypothetical protein
MRMQGLLISLVALNPLLAGAAAVPPPPPRTLPGEVRGEMKARWLAPFVSISTRSLAGTRTTTIQWFRPDGQLHRQLQGANVDARLGYAYQYGDKHIIYGINGDWQFPLAQKGVAAGYITATQDSRTFVYQFYPKQGEIAADLYVTGKRVATVGPYLQYLGRDVHLGEDGSLALLTWKDSKKKTPQVVVAGPEGQVRFRVDCEGPVDSPTPAPGGAGVLVRSNAGGAMANTYYFYTQEGKVSSLDVGPNADFMAWLPGQAIALFSTSIGVSYRFHLIDWTTGIRLWTIPDPNPRRVPGSAPSVAHAGDYLLLAGRQFIKLGDDFQPVRSIQAVHRKTIRVSRWLPAPLQPAPDDGRLLRLGKKVFLITDEEFAEIKVEEIAARKNGWR